MDENNRNMLLAILLSGMVLIGWHFFYAGPKLQEAQERERRLGGAKDGPDPRRRRQATAGTRTHRRATWRRGLAIGQPASCRVWRRPARRLWPRPARTASPPRRASPSMPQALKGSISLKGGRIDDLVLPQYKQEANRWQPAGRAVLAVGLAAAILCGERLVCTGWLNGESADRRDALDGDQHRSADRQLDGHAAMGQRRRPVVHAHHQVRQDLPVHYPRRGAKQERRRTSRSIPTASCRAITGPRSKASSFSMKA